MPPDRLRHTPFPPSDYVAHKSKYFTRNEDVVTDTIATVTSSIAHEFPRAPAAWLAPALGNDDFYPNYFLNASKVPNPHLKRIASNWTRILPPGSPERATFVRHGGCPRQHTVRTRPFDARTAGYYRRNVTSTLSVLVLQTILYSVKNHGVSPEAEPDPGGQFAWIRAELDSARSDSRRVILMSHIPPIADDFSSEHLWRLAYQRTMLTILAEYSDVVTGSLYGHVHRNLIAPLDSVARQGSGDPAPVLTLDAVSPVYNNNPGVGAVEDLAVFASDLDGDHPAGHDSPWRCAYSTRHAFGIPSLSGRHAAEFRRRVLAGGPLCKAYLRTTSVREDSLDTFCKSKCQARKLCLLESPLLDEVDKCMQNEPTCGASSTRTSYRAAFRR